MALSRSQTRIRRRPAGFSMIEVMVAMLVLAVGLVASAAVISVAIANNGRSRFDTTATALAESAMERVVALPSRATGAAASTSITDCAGTTFPMSTTLGGAPLITSGPFTGSVDFSQPPVPNYSMRYSACSSAGRLIYDVRWRIDSGPTPFTQLVTVSARNVAQTGNNGTNRFAAPVRLRTIRGTF
jgi:prepilin-type N-terminal cleavage/methylation domain-containing protein